MRLFLYPLAIIIGLLIGFSHISFPIIRNIGASHTLPIHKTLYLSRNLDNDEILNIIKAVNEWQDDTNNEVSFDIKKLPQDNIDPENSIIILNVDEDYPEVIEIDATNDATTLAFYDYINKIHYIAFISDRINIDDYASITMHELGHSLGMEHLKGINNIGALMFPSIDFGSDHITHKDLIYFCQLYHCDANKFHTKL